MKFEIFNRIFRKKANPNDKRNEEHHVNDEMNKNIHITNHSHNSTVYNDCLLHYKNGDIDCEANLALCYLSGIGVQKYTKKAFTLLVEGAINDSKKALRLLGDYYYIGEGGYKNVNIANYIYSIEKGQNPSAVYQYKTQEQIIFLKNGNSTDRYAIMIEENKHLESVLSSIDSKILKIKSKITDLSQDTWWMDMDQRIGWVEENYYNQRLETEIFAYQKIRNSPYFGRMDSDCNGMKYTYYIGQETYYEDDGTISVASVWSEYGKMYRAKNTKYFEFNNYKYEVRLRRQLNIVNSEITDIFDEFTEGSTASNAQITDPYLVKILESKKGEANITNIIKTIQLNQNEIIEYDFTKSLIVQGCAGSGKTMILLHRLANMKYNQKLFHTEKIKIITPNEQFNLFIKDLTIDLKINEIDKITMAEYYLEILNRYRLENQELYKKLVRSKDRNGYFVETEENARRVSGPTVEIEKTKIKEDSELSKETIKYIYSDGFYFKLKDSVIKLKQKIGYTCDYGKVIINFSDICSNIFTGLSDDAPNIVNNNYTCTLYLKTLLLNEYYGATFRKDTLLCIDEGQDISKNQYGLLKRVNSENLVFNIYGDINQQTSDCTGINNWVEVQTIIDANYFILNENYRNCEEIIKFYNKDLGMNNLSLGVRTKDVEWIGLDLLESYIKLHILLKNRIAVVSKDELEISSELKDYCTRGKVSQGKATLLTVKQSKGLEFDVVFVFQDKMTKNEKYIAFTRALSELYILNSDVLY